MLTGGGESVSLWASDIPAVERRSSACMQKPRSDVTGVCLLCACRSLLSEWDSPEQYTTRTEAELASQVFSAVDTAAGAGPAVLLALISQSPPEVRF